MNDVGRQLARTRREFLRAAAGLSVGGAIMGSGLLSRTGISVKKRKVIVITFGGGVRDQETFAPEGQENIPHLMRELIPQSSFFPEVVNHGILGHYVATASLATGVYETFNNFSAVPPEFPTVFEYFQKDLKRPALDTWVVAPSNGFHRIGESSHRLYGCPPCLYCFSLNGKLRKPWHKAWAGLFANSKVADHPTPTQVTPTSKLKPVGACQSCSETNMSVLLGPRDEGV